MVGLTEAAAILGVSKANLRRDVKGLPEPAQDRGIEGFEVRATPLWHRQEIEDLKEARRTLAKTAGRR